MKQLLVLFLSLGLLTSVYAQTFQEWFNQKQTQTKYLLEQIAVIGSHAVQIKKGYDLTKSGLGSIKSLKNGDFNLHRDHFNSLSQVKPSIRNYGKVSEILSFQNGLMKIKMLALRSVRESDLIALEEANYVDEVYKKLLQESGKDIKRLTVYISDDELELPDAERVERIDKLHREIQNKYVFSKAFLSGLKALIAQRAKEQQNVSQLRKINGIKVK